jgi:hypothetical protein
MMRPAQRWTVAWCRGLASVLSLALAVPAGAQAPEPSAPPAPGRVDAVITTTTTTTTVTTAEGEPPPAWTLATLPDDPVSFHGLVDRDDAGLGPGSMMYPTGGLGVLGLLVGVATHAALVGGTRSRQESRLQLSADSVLDPYRDVLSQFRSLELERRALEKTPSAAVAHLRDAKDAPAGELFVQAVPAFAMTPDSAALVLDETVVLRPSPTSDKGVEQIVRVVSAPRVEADLRAAWGAGDGAALKATAAALMAESLDIALRQSRHPVDDKAPLKTLRFAFGDRERMERAQLLEETCQHLVMRTLRGALLVVPHRTDAALPAGCQPAPVVAVRRAAAIEDAAASAVAPGASAASAAAV